MEIIFCRYGDAEVIFDGSAPSIPHLFSQPVPHHQFRAEIAVPHRCAVRKCPTLVRIKEKLHNDKTHYKLWRSFVFKELPIGQHFSSVAATLLQLKP